MNPKSITMKKSTIVFGQLFLLGFLLQLSIYVTAQTPVAGKAPGKPVVVDTKAPSDLNVLPFRFINCKVHMAHGANSVHWGVADEATTQVYEVQKSSDGIEFVTIATIIPRRFTTDQYYEYSDGNPYEGANWYRIKAVDQDAIEYYSPIVTLKNIEIMQGVLLFPTVVSKSSSLQLQLKDQPSGCFEVKISNSFGSSVCKYSILHKAGTSSYPIEMSRFSALNPGIYFVSVRNEKGNVQVFRVSVN